MMDFERKHVQFPLYLQRFRQRSCMIDGEMLKRRHLRNMSFREKLAGEQAALQAKRLEADQQEHEATLAPTRARIADLQSVQKELGELRSELGAGLESFLASVKTLKGKNEQIERLRTEFRDVLEAKGVSGKKGLLEAEEFGQEQEIQEYKAARGQTGEAAGKTREVTKHIKAAVPGLAGRVAAKAKQDWKKHSPEAWRDRVSVIIDERIKEIDGELAELKLKTPEGQAEAQEVYRSKIGEKMGKQHFDFAKFELNSVRDHRQREGFPELDMMQIVRPEDLEAAKIIGEESAKRILGEEYVGKAKADFEKARAVPERADARQLIEYGDTLSEPRKIVQEAEAKRRELLRIFNQLHHNDPTLRERLSRYGEGHPDRYFAHLEEMALSGLSWDKVVAEMASAEQSAQLLREGRNTRTLFETNYSYSERETIRVIDPAYITRQGNRYLEFYRNLEPLLKPENFPLKNDVLFGLGKREGYGSSEGRHLVIDSKLQKELSQQSFEAIRDKTIKQDEADEKRQAKLIALIPEKVNAEWVERKLREFEGTHRDIISAHSEIAEQRKNAEAVLREIPIVRARLADRLDQRVKVSANLETRWTGDHNYVSAVGYAEERQHAAAELQTARDELQALERALRERQRALEKAWIKGSLKKEVDDLERQRTEKQERISALDRDRKQASQNEDGLEKELKSMVALMKLSSEITGRVLTVDELLDWAQQEASHPPELTAEQNQLLTAYDALKHQHEQAKQRYELTKKDGS